MPRWANKRDVGDLEIFRALEQCGAKPVRGRDCDIYARSLTDLRGLLLEVKAPGKRKNLRPIQRELQELFQSRYIVVESVDEALAAVGVMP